MSKLRSPFCFCLLLASLVAQIGQVAAQDALSYRQRDFRGANLTAINLVGADLTDAGFDQAKLTEANLSGAQGVRTLFRSADLSGANLSRATLEGAQFTDARARNTDFSEADLGGASFARADLTGANFTRARLDNADFRGAILEGATFDRARMGRALFDESPSADTPTSASPQTAPLPPPPPATSPAPLTAEAAPPQPEVDSPAEPSPRRPLFFRILWPFGGENASPESVESAPAERDGVQPPPVPESADAEIGAPTAAAPIDEPGQTQDAPAQFRPAKPTRPLFARILWPFNRKSDMAQAPAQTEAANNGAPADSASPADTKPNARGADASVSVPTTASPGSAGSAGGETVPLEVGARPIIANPRATATLFITAAVQPGGLPEPGLGLELYDVERGRVIDRDRTDRDGAARLRARAGRNYILRAIPRDQVSVFVEPSQVEFFLGDEGAVIQFAVRYAPPAGDLRSGIRTN